jgi:hypothetical protein
MHITNTSSGTSKAVLFDVVVPSATPTIPHK